MDHKHGNQIEGGGPMGHGEGLKGTLLMLLCCLPMIAIVLLLAVGFLR